ncbi:MAG: hypothetical protein ABGW77_05740 [Campylobacterales bacterium]
MGRKSLIVGGLFLSYLAYLGADPFLTYQEYAQQLYLHPGGISCAKCHGYYGEGRELGEMKRPIYQNRKRVGYRIVSIAAPNIQQVPLKRLKEQLFHENYQIMPRYPFLTEPEVKAIHYYLNFIAPKLYREALRRQEELLRRRAQQIQTRERGKGERKNQEGLKLKGRKGVNSESNPQPMKNPQISLTHSFSPKIPPPPPGSLITPGE